MKKILNILLILTIVPYLFSCTNWLNVTSQTDILEKDLYETGAGYRQSLNGIYSLMARGTLYGRELSWGFSTVMADTYYQYDVTSNNDIDDYYEDFLYGDIEDESMIENTYDPIWAAAYRVIANCNNLISYAEKCDTAIFEFGKVERDIILGEAKAVRALMHFEILRLFGASLVETGHDVKRLPYVDNFYTDIPTYYNTKEMLDLIIKDFEAARVLLKDHDFEVMSCFSETYDDQFSDDIEFPGSEKSKDISFMAYRGSRLNYFATTVLMARAYMFAENYDKAYETAAEIYKYGPHGEESVFEFDSFSTYSSRASNTSKFKSEILFGVYNDELIAEYADFLGDGESLRIDDPEDIFDVDTDDYRFTRLFETGTDFSKRWVTEGDYETIIPVIRLSEVYHIMSECMMRMESAYYNRDKAILVLQELRFDGRGCDASIAVRLDGKSDNEVLRAIWNDVLRESMDEGRASWTYKRTGEGFHDLEGPLPLPRKETDYLGL